MALKLDVVVGEFSFWPVVELLNGGAIDQGCSFHEAATEENGVAGGDEGVVGRANRTEGSLIDPDGHLAKGLQLGDAAGAASKELHRSGPIGCGDEITDL